MPEAELEHLGRRAQELEAESAQLREQCQGMTLGAAEARYRAIVESASDFAIFATDQDGRVTDWNEGAARTHPGLEQG